MSLLKLHNIGKIYNSNDILTIGIRNINLEFDLNEFVVIEGESGSGKSTLLNVIGANDSYEEGEMYFNGEETSHYGISEWEKYREENIATIFQDFNIIENLTVLENVMMALFRIDKLSDRKKIALDLIEKVGLSNQKNHKGSRLSGGEKQRCVIARALAKDSPVILADEPTGNLDMKSSNEIAKLLKDVSKDKLVIVVTHNPEFFLPYATRRVRIFDGSVESDEVIKKVNESKYEKKDNTKTKKQNAKNILWLGLINYKSRPKFSILMTFTLFIMAITLYVVLEIFGTNLINPLKKNYDSANINGKVIILSNNNEFKKDDIDYLVRELKPSYIMEKDNYSNYTLTIPSSAKGFDNMCEINVLYDPFNYSLNDNEAVLNLPYYYRDLSKPISELFLNANVEIDDIKTTYSLKNKNISLYLSNNTLTKYSTKIKSIYSQMRLGKTIINVYSFDINDELPDGYVNLLNANFWNVEGKKVSFDIKSKISFIVNDSNAKNEKKELVVEVNSHDYNLLFSDNESSNRISFYYENDKIARREIDDMPNNYVAYLSTSKTYVKDAKDIYVNNIIYYLLLVCFSVCFALLVNLIFSRSIKVYQSDFTIYKTLGISNKLSSKSLYIQFSLIFMPNLILLPLMSLLFAISKNSDISFIGLSNYIIILLVLLFIVSIVTYNFNRSIKNESIRKSLRRGSK